MKKIIGLDLGTNSIGWSVINSTDENLLTRIDDANSRIIPMTADILGNFEAGNSVSQTETRTMKRGARRLRERFLLRRERLLRILNHLDFLPSHFAKELDRYGKFGKNSEPKIAWHKEQGKNQFLFMDSFQEMVADFGKTNPSLIEGGKLVPYDWTLYYLRKKALTQKISREELAWVLLSFLQKRGYSQVAGVDETPEEEKQPKSKEYFHKGKIMSITDTGQEFKKSKIFLVALADGLKGKLFRREKPDWEGETKDIIVTIALKDGKERMDESLNIPDCKFKIPTEAEWNEKWELVKKRTQNDISGSGKTIGSYIYDAILENPTQKIIGKLVRVVDREFYYDELHRIMKAQCNFHSELQDRKLYEECISLLYPTNEAYRKSIEGRNFEYLIADDITLYQRPLKTKKSLIANCQYETMKGVDGKKYGLKCIAKSHPLFEEFRLWQWIANLRIFKREDTVDGKLTIDHDITVNQLPNMDAYAELFEWLSHKADISMEDLLSFPGFNLEKRKREKLSARYRWNYVEDKSFPCCTTRAKIADRLNKLNISEDVLTDSLLDNLWQILYSVSKKTELETAMRTFCLKNFPQTDAEEFAKVFSRFPSFDKDYGSYSAKAIKKLLPLMRMGKYWNVNAIDCNTKDRIQKIIDGEFDESIQNRVREKTIKFNQEEDFQGLPVWLACYVVYNRHSEAGEVQRWEKPEDIDSFIKTFKSQSLHNPIVEQITLETLKTVRDIWATYGKPSEIHIELGRELKKTNKEKERIMRQNAKNEIANLRAKAMLLELANPDMQVDNVRPYSPSQQELYRIYEDGVLNDSDIVIPDYITETLKKYEQSDRAKWPTHSEIIKYKCWLEQNYRSPYTGRIIPLSKLFTPAYQIEHVIPQSRYFDDSFSNKVICEEEVNQLKDSQLGYEFIKNHHGQKLSGGIEIFSIEAYEEFVKKHYGNDKRKMTNLLLEDIPEKFIARQMNDSRYISKLISNLLSNIVREKDEDGVVSKNVIAVNGNVTTQLKRDWGMNDVWNRIILPRFQRMEEIDSEHKYTALSREGHLIPQMPIHMKLEKKRIDHRHHAMDAIVIACCTRSHVNLLSNEAAKSGTRYDLQHKLREHKKVMINGRERNDFGAFLKPWATFTEDAQQVLENAIVSFKQVNRILNRTSNYYQHFVEKADGKMKKELVKQEKGDRMAIRKSLHKESVYGHVNLRRIKEVSLKVALTRAADIVDRDIRDAITLMLAEGKKLKDIKAFFEKDKDTWADFNEKKIPIFYFSDEEDKKCYAIRTAIDESFNEKTIREQVTDLGIQAIMLRHLANHDGKPAEAFSPEGIEEMNRNIVALNGGKQHKPIYKVRKYEKAQKFAVGESGNKKTKFVEGDKGKNLFFAIYADEEGKRAFETISLIDVIHRMKEGLSAVPEESDGKKLLFYLEVNDLVYIPREEEKDNIDWNNIDKTRIYKFVSSDKKQAFFMPCSFASAIVNKVELGPLNKIQSINGQTIQSVCIPFKVNRLGIIQP